jgi:hypothetical protein
MEKNIKDYLHLYLGCECRPLDNTKQGWLMGIRIMQGVENAFLQYDLNSTENLIPFKLNELKPILRPLSDMSDEENLEFGGLWAFAETYIPDIEDTHDPYEIEPEAFRFLLSEHFDLFGLIEAGLAIDKTTLNKTNT